MTWKKSLLLVIVFNKKTKRNQMIKSKSFVEWISFRIPFVFIQLTLSDICNTVMQASSRGLDKVLAIYTETDLWNQSS